MVKSNKMKLSFTNLNNNNNNNNKHYGIKDTMILHIRSKFWIIRITQLVKSIINKCTLWFPV